MGDGNMYHSEIVDLLQKEETSDVEPRHGVLPIGHLEWLAKKAYCILEKIKEARCDELDKLAIAFTDTGCQWPDPLRKVYEDAVGKLK